MTTATRTRIMNLCQAHPGITKKEEEWLDCNFRTSWVNPVPDHPWAPFSTAYSEMRETVVDTNKVVNCTTTRTLDLELIVLKGMKLSLKYQNDSRAVLLSLVHAYGDRYKEQAKSIRKQCRALRAEIREFEIRLSGEAKEAAKTAARIRRALRAK